MLHLTARSGFSFLRAYGKVEQIVSRAKEIGASGVGIADYCSTWGHIPLQKACDAAGIQPYFGLQVPVVFQCGNKEARYDLVSLVAAHEGHLPLIYDALAKAQEQQYYRPRLTWAQVGELRGSGVGVIVDHLRSDRSHIEWVQKHQYLCALSPFVTPLNGMIVAHDLPAIAAFGPNMPRSSDREALETALSISDRQRIGEVDRPPMHMTKENEYVALARQVGVPGGVVSRAQENLSSFGQKGKGCRIPRAQNLQCEYSEFRTLVDKGAQDRWGGVFPSPAYHERLEAEMAVIKAKDFHAYFVFVADLVAWAKERMLVGPGRGSSGGSLVCYVLGITNVDPIVHGTLFERFIDQFRPDWPDIDVDFPDVKRHQVLKYLKERYGAGKVAKLGTISEFKQKSALNDVARAIGVPFEEARNLSRLIGDDQELGEVEEQPEVKKLLDKYPNFRKALAIEGHPRHSGVHAAGIVVSADNLNRVVAVSEEGVASCVMQDAENIGLLKMDALGLTTLSTLEIACSHAGLPWSTLYNLTYDDPEVFAVFNNDRLTGVFQFEGHTVRGLTKRVAIDRFSDLCAISALARPGPLEGGGAATWVRRRATGEVFYEHPLLEAILENSLGVLAYQEQMMRVVREIGSFPEADVNKFRKAIGKKLPEELKKFETQFFEKARVAVGDVVAKSLWHQMEESGSYAFNFSHAVAYSMLSYWTAWMKRYYPMEFSLAQLQNSRSDEQTRALLQELTLEGVDVIAFDPERSLADWSVQGKQLVGGFTTVKGIGLVSADKIVRTRQTGGPNWREKIGAGVRAKIEDPKNWAWADVQRIARCLTSLYTNPETFISAATPHGVGSAVTRICDIPAGKASWVFAGELTKKQLRNSNDADRAAKRGARVSGPAHFLNLYFDDGSGEIGCTISRFKYEEIGKSIWDDDGAEGKLFLVRGSCINENSSWVFVDKIVCIEDVRE